MRDAHAAPTHSPSDSHGHGHGPPPLSEPKTPLWLTALGAVLFLAVALAWALAPDATPAVAASPAGPDAGAPSR